MTVRTVLRMGDARLLRVAQPVPEALFGSEELASLVTDLIDTMRAESGAGIAAPQIGVDLRVVIFGGTGRNPRHPDAPEIPFTVLCNPVIEPLDDAREAGWEGCLSVPGLRGEVKRFSRIRYTGRDSAGHAIDRTVAGFHARVVQHECDHLDGILYPMRIEDLRRFGFTATLFPEWATQ